MNNYLTRLGRMDKKIHWLFVFSVLAFAGFAAVVYQQKSTQEKNRKSIYLTYRVITRLERVNTFVVETESALRSYLITKDPVWKQELHSLQQQLYDSIKAFRSTVSDNVLVQQQLDTLEALLQQKKATQDSIANAQLLTGAFLEKIRAKGATRSVKYAIMQLLSRFVRAEEELLAQQIADNEEDYNTGIWIALGAGLFVFFLVLFMLFQLNNDMRLRKRMEDQLISSEVKYRNLIENAGVVVFTTDIDGKILFANNHVLKLTGYNSQDLIGKHFSILIDPAWLEQVMNFYVQQFQQRIPSTTMHFLTRSRNGEEIWVEQFAQLLFDDDHITGFQCMVRNITEKKKIELELIKSEHRLQSILDNTTALIFIKDLEGRYIIVNKRFKEMLGLTDEMVINKTDYDFNPKEMADRYHKNDLRILKTLRAVESEEVVETTEGRRTLLVIKFPLLDDKRQAFGVSGIASDITEHVEDRIQLQEALKNVKDSKELQEQFLANMSHEIRTPLNGIQGMTSLLLETPLNEDQKDFALMIKHSLNNLTAIVNDILDISNIRAGKLMLSKIVFNIIDPIDAIKIQFSNQVGRKKLSFNVIIEENVPKLIIGDPYRLKQVLVSLIDNAVKFTESGSVTLHVGLKEQSAISTIIEFTITDTGMGIAEDKLTTIFESFAQANIEISRSFGGAGLGLAIGKGLVQMQGGNITVQSTRGKGSVFSFYIPYEVPVGGDEQTGIAELVARLKGKRFLIVEDNQVNQQLIAFVLQKAGAIIEIASHGRQAVDYLENGHEYDLVIMDLQMPVMDGYETATHIRKVLGLNIPILALTATALKNDQERCKEVEIDDFMLKPFDFNDLYRRLVALLDREQNIAPTQMNEAVPVTSQKKLYDLSILKEMGDPESIIDIISLILTNTFTEIQKLPDLAKQKKWPELFKVAHKVKGSVSVLQAGSIVQLLAGIETSARQETDLQVMEEKVAGVMTLFADLKTQLQEEKMRLQKEIS
jgi:PAS domain S-box-containing protein